MEIRPPPCAAVLAPSKPADAAVNAMYAGSSSLLSRVTFVSGSPSEAVDLLRAGVLTARSAVVLNASKVSASADGSDNLNDDTDAIVATSTIFRLNPSLHVVSASLLFYLSVSGRTPRCCGRFLNGVVVPSLFSVLCALCSLLPHPLLV